MIDFTTVLNWKTGVPLPDHSLLEKWAAELYAEGMSVQDAKAAAHERWKLNFHRDMMKKHPGAWKPEHWTGKFWDIDGGRKSTHGAS